jgi:hypothetical protein
VRASGYAARGRRPSNTRVRPVTGLALAHLQDLKIPCHLPLKVTRYCRNDVRSGTRLPRVISDSVCWTVGGPDLAQLVRARRSSGKRGRQR